MPTPAFRIKAIKNGRAFLFNTEADVIAWMKKIRGTLQNNGKAPPKIEIVLKYPANY